VPPSGATIDGNVTPSRSQIASPGSTSSNAGAGTYAYRLWVDGEERTLDFDVTCGGLVVP
jgi:hypothetical protein